MAIWRRFTDWWFGVPANPIEQDEFGTTVIYPPSTSVDTKLWPAFTSLRKFMVFVAGAILSAIIGWTVLKTLEALCTGHTGI